MIAQRNFCCCILVLTITGLLSSCTSLGVRPKDANLFEAIGNHNSGEFQRQTRRQLLVLNDSKRSVTKQRRETASLRAALERSKEEKRLLVSNLNKLRVSNKLLENQILAIKVKNLAELSRKNSLVDKVFILNKKINTLKKEVVSKSESSLSSSAYEKKISVLKGQIRILRKLMLAQ